MGENKQETWGAESSSRPKAQRLTAIHVGQTFKGRCVIQRSGWELVFVGRKYRIHGFTSNVQNQCIGKEHLNKSNVADVETRFR